MNRRRRHHNIYGLTELSRRGTFLSKRGTGERYQAGYALVALLAIMSLLALFALAAAPSIRQQALREREKEAIFRGEQVADAIREYYLSKRRTSGAVGDQALPTSVDQLLEGIPVQGGSKKRQILRLSAARDPLSSSGEWRLVSPRSQRLLDFQRAVLLYAGNMAPQPENQELQQLQSFSAPPITEIVNSPTSAVGAGEDDFGADTTGPFVGVSSRSATPAVLHYYDIDRHNQWIFTPLFRR